MTTAEMETIKAQDAKWAEPSASLIERAKAIGAVYNGTTGYFELNGLTDLTAAEMENVITYGKTTFTAPECNIETNSGSKFIRTNWTQYGLDATMITPNLDYSFWRQSSLEVLRLPTNPTYMLRPLTAKSFAACSTKLHTVLGYLDLSAFKSGQMLFDRCSALKEVNLTNLNASIVIKGSPLLSVDSVRYMVANAINTGPISITVHPDVFAKLADESNTEWHAIFTDAQERQISFIEAVQTTNN